MNETTLGIVLAVFASTGFWSFITTIYNRRQDAREHKEGDLGIIKSALLSVLYDKLYERSVRLLRVGQTTAEDRENIHQLLKPYEALGGDGLIHDLVDRVDELPLYVDSE